MDSDIPGRDFRTLLHLLTETPGISDGKAKISSTSIQHWEVPEEQVAACRTALLENTQPEKYVETGPEAKGLPPVEMLKGIVFKKILEIENNAKEHGALLGVLEQKILQVEALYDMRKRANENLAKEKEIHKKMVMETAERIKSHSKNRSELQKEHKLVCDRLLKKAQRTDVTLQQKLSDTRNMIVERNRSMTHELELQNEHQQEPL